ncbi:M protein repeat protein [Streptomyces laurentii]|uniref:M protein repeat protein n=1 Tax=Streptomyces laurentii TaxID=39478 RepID=A0A160NUY0_STRLU|nr:M protein repeat protein [Streptomyces laurentii]
MSDTEVNYVPHTRIPEASSVGQAIAGRTEAHRPRGKRAGEPKVHSRGVAAAGRPVRVPGPRECQARADPPTRSPASPTPYRRERISPAGTEGTSGPRQAGILPRPHVRPLVPLFRVYALWDSAEHDNP